MTDRETGPGPFTPAWTEPPRAEPPRTTPPPLPPPLLLDESEAKDGREEERDERGKKKKKKDKKDKLGSARGIETMFRTSYRTHVDMSALADNKANIMVTVNALILSITLASISPKIDANPWLLIPTAALLLSTLVSLVFAVLAARPRVTNRALTLEDVRRNRANILFFGNFVHLREEEFLQGMTEIIHDGTQLYQNMMRDIYSLGAVLQRKFRLLRLSYNIFMAGLILAVLAFLFVLIAVVAPGGPGSTPS